MIPAVGQSRQHRSATWPASTMHRDTARARAGGQRADHLAVQRLVVEPALPGDDHVGRRDVVGQPGVLGDDGRPGLPAAAQRQQRRTRAPGRPGAGLRADRSSGQRVEFGGPRRHPLLEHLHGRRIGALLGAEDPRRAHRAQQRVFDVGGGDQLDAGQLVVGLRRPPSASISPRPPSVQALPPRPTTIRRRTGLQRRGDQLADPAAVRGDRGLAVGGPPSSVSPQACAHSM